MTSRAVTVAELITRARDMADMSRTAFCSDEEIVRYISIEYCELYDLLVTKYEHYYTGATPFTIVQDGSDSYALPTDFYKLSGVDKQLNAGSSWQTMLPFNFAERNEIAALNIFSQRYCIVGDRIMFRGSGSTQTVQLWYIPPPKILDKKITISAVSASTDTLTATAHGMLNGDFLYVRGVSLPGGIIASQKYFVVGATTNTFQVSLIEDDAAIDITSAGSGVIKAEWYGAGQSIDGVSGWDDLVVINTAIRMLSKEESDTKDLQIKRALLVKRIEAAAQSRDQGNCHSVVDIRSQADSAEWPTGWTF